MTEYNKDLIALIWADNTCYTSVVELSEVDARMVYDGEDKKYWSWGELVIDESKGTWKQRNKSGQIGDHFSNPSGLWNESRYGLIGIYDRTNIKHLGYMIRHAQEAVESMHCRWG